MHSSNNDDSEGISKESDWWLVDSLHRKEDISTYKGLLPMGNAEGASLQADPAVFPIHHLLTQIGTFSTK